MSHRRNQKRRLRILRRRAVWGLFAEPLGLWLTDGSSRPSVFTYEEARMHFAPEHRRGWAPRVLPERLRPPRRERHLSAESHRMLQAGIRAVQEARVRRLALGELDSD